MPVRRKRRNIAYRASRWLPGFSVAALLALTLFGLHLVFHHLPALTSVKQFTDDPGFKTVFDELKWLLTLIVTTAGFFAIAQSAAAWFSAQSFGRQAEDALDRIKEIESDLRERYPLFSRADQLRREAYHELALTLRAASKANNEDEGLDWRESFYDNMPVEDRQRLLSVERFITIDLLDGFPGEDSYLEDLRRLANFYSSKFEYEHRLGFGQLGDLERSERYLKIACEKDRSAFYLWNDLGLLYLQRNRHLNPDGSKAEYIEDARKQFEKSVRIQNEQQRGHYNLSVVSAEKKEWSEAANHLREACRHSLWERTAVPAFRGDALYNLGCSLARLAEEQGATEARSSHVRDCLQALGEAAEIGLVRPDTVKYDYETGDICWLRQFGKRSVQDELERLRFQLSAKRQQAPGISRSLSNRLKHAYRSARRSLRGEY
jgi:hypothetical protein